MEGFDSGSRNTKAQEMVHLSFTFVSVEEKAQRRVQRCSSTRTGLMVGLLPHKKGAQQDHVC